MEEIKNKIYEIEQEIEMLYHEGYTDNSTEIKEKQAERKKLYAKIEVAKENEDSRTLKPDKEQVKIKKEIYEIEQEIQMLYYEGYTDNSPEMKEKRARQKELYERVKTEKVDKENKFNNEQVEILKEISKINEEIQMLYYEGYTDDSPEIKVKQEEIKKLYTKMREIPKKESRKENVSKPKSEFALEEDSNMNSNQNLTYDPLKEPDLHPEAVDFYYREATGMEGIHVDLNINKKTGICKIVSEGFETETRMDASNYTRKGLKKFREELLNKENIEEEDKKYIKNIDPTIYKAYLEYDNLNKDKNHIQATKMYIDTVIKKSRAMEKNKIINDVKMPGKVNVDIGWHPRMKDTREKEQGFKKLKNILASFRANKILKKHGVPGPIFGKKMDLANVIDNRKLIGRAIIGISGIAALGSAVNLQLSDPEGNQKSKNDQQIKNEMPAQNKASNLDNQINENSEKENDTKHLKSKKENNKIYPGDIITAEQYSAIYGSADSNEPNSALNTKEMIGVNKIACVIDGITYSSKNYLPDEIYKMAEKANVKVKYHVDKAIEIDGKICVQVNEIDNPSPTYIYNDNGQTKRIDGKKWNGDTGYSSIAGWMNEKDVKKLNVKSSEKVNKIASDKHFKSSEQELDR